jgi:DNA (cytosine-5)-methyltransferase 1
LKAARRRKTGRGGAGAGRFEIVVVSFAGGGGSSLGIEDGFGRAVDVAVNHDADAVAMHMLNHPHTRHYCQNVLKVDPVEATGGRPVGLFWASPDCKHFSRAKGSQPVEKKIRDLAWVVVRWAARVAPRVIMLENVREFEDWGPLVPKVSPDGTPHLRKDGRPKMVPDPTRKGITFRRWVGQLRALGYQVEWRRLNAADYGAPTTRVRLFVVARRDGAPIVWPEPTHGPGRAKPWRSASEIIDWSLPCHSIFLTPEQVKERGLRCNRPLKEKTMKRIAMGLRRFVFDNPRPFIVRADHGGDHFRGQGLDRPLATVTGSHGYGLVAPFMTAQFGEAKEQVPRVHSAERPLPTITPRAGGGFPVIAAHISQFFGGMVGKDPDAPLPTVTSIDHHGLVAAALVQYNQEKGEGDVRGQSLAAPLNTVVTENRFGLVSAFLGKHYGDRPDGTAQVGSPADGPVPTVTARGTQTMLTAANLVRIGQHGGNGSYSNAATDPLTTVVSKQEHCLAVANMIRMNFGDKQAWGVDEPLRTVLAGANHHALVMAFLTKYFGNARAGQGCDGPLHTITSKARFGLVTVRGQDYVIVDIGLRMLTPRELYRATGFPESYRIDPLVTRERKTKGGRTKVYQVRLGKSGQTKMCGNAVPPMLPAALVRANFPEECAPARPSRPRRKAAGVAS